MRLVGSAVLLGLAVATALMSAAGTLWVLGLTIFLLRFSGQGMMTHAATVAMARWFVATRGRAIAFSGLGFALGEATLPILFVALKGWFDWRTLWLFATATLLLMTGVLLLLLRRERTPQSFAQESRSAGMQGKTWARKDVVRNRLFWLMLPAILGPGAWNTAFFFHQVHFAEAKGWAHIDLVALFPVFTAAGVGSMMLTGVLVDRFGSTRITGLHLLPMAAGYALIGTAQGLPLAALGLALMGIANGAQSTVGASLWAEVYGTANLGRIRAMIGAIMAWARPSSRALRLADRPRHRHAGAVPGHIGVFPVRRRPGGDRRPRRLSTSVIHPSGRLPSFLRKRAEQPPLPVRAGGRALLQFVRFPKKSGKL